MIHAILSNPTGSLAQFGWISLIIPCWIEFVVLCGLLYFRWRRVAEPKADKLFHACALGVLLYLLVCISLTLLTAFIDGIWVVRYPIGYATIPLLPLAVIFVLDHIPVLYWWMRYIFKNEEMIVSSQFSIDNSTPFRRFLTSMIALFHLMMLFSLVTLLSWSFGGCLWGICREKSLPSVFLFFVWIVCTYLSVLTESIFKVFLKPPVENIELVTAQRLDDDEVV
jgi:hypothetical protein